MAERQDLVLYFNYLLLFFRRKRLRRMRSARPSVHLRKRLQSIQLVNAQWISTICACTLMAFAYGLLKERQIWSFYKPNQSYWERAHVRWNDRMWVEHLRMRREAFHWICNELRHRLRKNKRFRISISVEARVAMALWRLATGLNYCSIV